MAKIESQDLIKESQGRRTNKMGKERNPYHKPAGTSEGGQFTTGQFEDAVNRGAGLPSKDLEYFNTYMQRWVSGIDADARDTAYSLAVNNKELHEYLLREAFGDNYPPETILYRVGGLGDIEEGRIVSMFASKNIAESFQSRMGVDRIQEFSVYTKAIVPTLSGSGEVWVTLDEIM